MRLAKTMKSAKIQVEKDLEAFLDAKIKNARKVHKELVPILVEIKRLSMRNGKRTRPYLCWLGCVAVEKKNGFSRKLRWAMLGLELLHTHFLIHDDIVDRDDQRRGGPALHKAYGVTLQNKNINSKHAGVSYAIIAGDVVLGWAGECIDKTGSNEANVLFHSVAQNTLYGQLLEVGLPRIKIDKATLDELKTSHYSVIGPLSIGGLIAGAKKQTLHCFLEYGLLVGEAYQLRDDVLDNELDKDELHTRVLPLIEAAIKRIEKLKLSSSTERLFQDFARFAVKRRR